jgi:hypothetical protein
VPLCLHVLYPQDAVVGAKQLLSLTTESLTDLLSPQGLPVLASVLHLSADLLEWVGPTMRVYDNWPLPAPLYKTYTGDQHRHSGCNLCCQGYAARWRASVIQVECCVTHFMLLCYCCTARQAGFSSYYCSAVSNEPVAGSPNQPCIVHLLILRLHLLPEFRGSIPAGLCQGACFTGKARRQQHTRHCCFTQ